MNKIKLEKLIQCPSCKADLIVKEKIYCSICRANYFCKKNFIDFVSGIKIDRFTKKSMEVWGEDLHKEGISGSIHLRALRARLQDEYEEIQGEVLEIGFGRGGDLKELAKNTKIVHLYGLDIGKNCQRVANAFINIRKIHIVRADANSLPFKTNKFNGIYSYGVLHHTKQPSKSLLEIKRVLKKDGLLLLYLYSNHKSNFTKRTWVVIEKIIMSILNLAPYKVRIIFCIGITPISWILFTVPSLIIKKAGYIRLSQKIPLNWGTTPFSILPDIKDRFMASINHRYSRASITELLSNTGFSQIKVIEDHTGLYIAAKKR